MQSLRTALADRYAIERELGRGGNAIVYLARDLRHNRKVALKVLNPELALSVRTERFLREIQIAAKLTHPHILPLHDSGTLDGLLYYVMPYVPGESLRDRLNREKQLPIEDALKITQDVGVALGHAHRQGVIHRDIKPENIMLSEGGAIVADFGIARALTVAGDQTVTESGIAVGTPSYMSPEQAAGGEMDARSDVYSLGCVLYEMLAGHPPFTGATAQEILARQTLDPVPSVRAARSAIPASFERALEKALAKQPVDRFSTPEKLAQALTTTSRPVPARRQVLVAGAALLVVSAMGFALKQLLPRSEPLLAVLPCTNVSTDSANEYFSQGIAGDLIGALQAAGLQVSAQTSALALKGPDFIGEAKTKLHATHVVECKVRRVGPLLRVRAGLVDAAHGQELWGDEYERRLTNPQDIFAVQDQITRAIAGALQIKLKAGRARAEHGQTTSLEAYQEYQQGRYFWNQRGPTGMRLAIQHFEEAIRLDSNYALAYAGLADAYFSVGSLNYTTILPGDAARARQREAALKALALDSLLAEAHVAFSGGPGGLAETVRHLRRAIELKPDYAWAHSRLAIFLVDQGRLDESIHEAREARRLDPLSSSVNSAVALLVARHYDEAIDAARTTVEQLPEYAGGHHLLGRTYLAKGMLPEAALEFEQAMAASGGGPNRQRGFLGNAYARLGRRDDALKLLAALQGEAAGPDVPPNTFINIALVEVGLRQYDAALATLGRSSPEQLSGQVLLDPAFDSLRHDPRFVEIMRAKGIEK